MDSNNLDKKVASIFFHESDVNRQVVYRSGNYLLSTDNHSVVYFEDSDPDKIDLPKFVGDINKILIKGETGKKVLVADIKNAISKADVFEEWKGTECASCLGVTTVSWQYSHKGEFYDLEEECPICKGAGEIDVKKTGRMLHVPNQLVIIGIAFFQTIYVSRITEVADLCGIEEIEVFPSKSPKESMACKIGKYMVVIMPYNNKEMLIEPLGAVKL